MKPSERYRLDAQLIRAFRETYVDLLNSSQMSHHAYGLSKLVPKVDHEVWMQKRSAVAAAAGAAATAYNSYGGKLTMRNAAYITSNVDPMTNWEMSLGDPEQLSPETVVAAVESAAARAGQEAAEAAQREKGLTGVIAAFLRWP